MSSSVSAQNQPDSNQVSESAEQAGGWLRDTLLPWLTDTAAPAAVSVVVILLGAIIVRWLAHRGIDRIMKGAEHGRLPGRLGSIGRSVEVAATPGSSRRTQRAQSMGSLLKNIATAVIFGIAVVMALAEVGADVAPILASAGVLGLAIGFGAQSLVSDFLSGIAILLEDQYGVGDVVDLGEAIGTVESVGLRITRVRAVDGTVWYVRNGEILRVGNQSMNWARTVLDIGVAYGEDIQRVRDVLGEVAKDLFEAEEFKGKVIEAPEVWGVQELAADSVVVRVVLKTAPLQQWAVAREMRQRIKTRFDAEGIEIPFSQRVVWHRSDDGTVVSSGQVEHSG
ncbi:mechanosensitive ion channel family protein [Nocardioidaceae bacterium]|nr:mechanosensitive ion channel family protein [Nocardioidaceae bacterium]